jgi:hypothetical protein
VSNWEHANEVELREAREAYALDDPKHPDYGGSMELETLEHPDIVLFTGDPAERMRQMQETAQVLAEPVRQRHTVTISGREHVRVEGWTMLGALLGVHPYLVWTRRMKDDHDELEIGWEARVEARTIDGRVVGSAEAECLYMEANWKGRDDYALRSMAQTRATSKALRQPLGFVITLAGFDPTPAEEMVADSPFREPDLARDKRQVRAILAKLKKAEVPGFDQDAVDLALQTHYGTTQLSQLNAKDTADLLARLLEKEKEYGL